MFRSNHHDTRTKIKEKNNKSCEEILFCKDYDFEKYSYGRSFALNAYSYQNNVILPLIKVYATRAYQLIIKFENQPDLPTETLFIYISSLPIHFLRDW